MAVMSVIMTTTTVVRAGRKDNVSIDTEEVIELHNASNSGSITRRSSNHSKSKGSKIGELVNVMAVVMVLFLNVLIRIMALVMMDMQVGRVASAVSLAAVIMHYDQT